VGLDRHVLARRQRRHGRLSRFNILYAPTVGATTVDETVSDATLRTYVDTSMGISLRRIKHFSAYEQGYGDGFRKDVRWSVPRVARGARELANAPTDEVGAFIFRHYRTSSHFDSFPT
jgi:hypothetical protein